MMPLLRQELLVCQQYKWDFSDLLTHVKPTVIILSTYSARFPLGFNHVAVMSSPQQAAAVQAASDK